MDGDQWALADSLPLRSGEGIGKTLRGAVTAAKGLAFLEEAGAPSVREKCFVFVT